jgi:hypothetical protein
MAVNEKISSLVRNQFPDFYKEEGEKFLAFMEAYYEYMEQNGKLTDAVRNLKSYTEINETTEEYLNYFIETFLPSLPVEVVADKRLLVKYIKEGNLSRGTLQSYKFLFRILFNEDLQLNYPSDQVLKASDGDWRIDRYLVADYDPANYKFIGKTVIGAESGATALVEDVVTRTVRGRHLMQILLSNIEGTFNHLEPLKLISETGGSVHAPRIDAGINTVTILSPGGEYQRGDIIKVNSDIIGEFAKVVVTDTVDLGGALTFSLVNGGSGYTPSDQPNGTVIQFAGGDGTQPASFVIGRNDLTDTFEVTTCSTFLIGNTVYGDLAPTVTFSDGVDRQMNYWANTLLSTATFGFPENGEVVTRTNFVDNESASIKIANTQSIGVGNSVFGLTSGANGVITAINNSAAGGAVFVIDGYKNFTNGETVRIQFANTSGTTVGTVSAFASNGISKHVVSLGYIGNTAISNIQVGDELVGLTSNCYAVVRKVISTVANGYSRGVGGADDRDLVTVIVSANSSANLSSQFDIGPIRGKGTFYQANNTVIDFDGFQENEGLRLVGSPTAVGNVALSSSNTEYENIYTKLEDSILFTNEQFGTIQRLSAVVSGSGYSIAPRITVTEPDIASLGIGEAYLTLHSDDAEWGTGNTSFSLDTTDRLTQTSTGAIGDVKQVISTSTLANGTYEIVARVWQKYLQRSPGNINWANNSSVTLESITGDYFPGTQDQRSADYTGTALIVNVDDRGILGKNSNIKANIGANGTISKLRIIDSGYSYDHNEVARLESTNRPLATSATVKISLGGVGNSEGYYASTRSQVSTTRGYIQDSRFYQDFSYQIISGVAIDRYREVALELVHPAGQALFGKYSSSSNAYLNVAATTSKTRRAISNGSITLTSGSYNISGVGTSFTSNYANNGSIIVEYSHKNFMTIPLNIVSNTTFANTKIAWANSTISSANAYYITGSF